MCWESSEGARRALEGARPCHQKKDPEREEAFRTTLAEELKALDLPKDTIAQ